MNFKQHALDFVRDNNCASHTPIELIQKAMEFGANQAMKTASDKVKDARIHLELIRQRNLRG